MNGDAKVERRAAPGHQQPVNLLHRMDKKYGQGEDIGHRVFPAVLIVAVHENTVPHQLNHGEVLADVGDIGEAAANELRHFYLRFMDEHLGEIPDVGLHYPTKPLLLAGDYRKGRLKVELFPELPQPADDGVTQEEAQ
ncbi:hypothetical protein ES703_109167 [subsurface metagenome]